MNSGISLSIFHGLKCFEIHRMENITAIIIECKTWSIGIPSVSCIPFFNFSNCRVYTICIIFCSGFGKKTFYCRREKQPVGIRRIDTTYECKFLDITFLSCFIKWHPKLVVCSQETFCYIGCIYQRLTLVSPQKIIRTLRIYSIGIAFQSPFTKLLTHLSFFCIIVRKSKPWSYSGH